MTLDHPARKALEAAVARECALVDEWEDALVLEEVVPCYECGGGVSTLHGAGCSRAGRIGRLNWLGGRRRAASDEHNNLHRF